jgi:ring-1,2-phenylacetyl-CoA epoxidase subunit PaaD
MKPPFLRAADVGLPDHVTCPFCEGEDTELYSPFGGQLSVATYWCTPCRSPFEWIKWRPRGPKRPVD